MSSLLVPFAYDPQGNSVYPWNAVRGVQYTCPEKHPLIYKHGPIVCAHFAHKADANCTFQCPTGESELHWKAKYYLAEYAKCRAIRLFYVCARCNHQEVFLLANPKNVFVEYPLGEFRLDIAYLRNGAGANDIFALEIYHAHHVPYGKRDFLNSRCVWCEVDAAAVLYEIEQVTRLGGDCVVGLHALAGNWMPSECSECARRAREESAQLAAERARRIEAAHAREQARIVAVAEWRRQGRMRQDVANAEWSRAADKFAPTSTERAAEIATQAAIAAHQAEEARISAERIRAEAALREECARRQSEVLMQYESYLAAASENTRNVPITVTEVTPDTSTAGRAFVRIGFQRDGIMPPAAWIAQTGIVLPDTYTFAIGEFGFVSDCKLSMETAWDVCTQLEFVLVIRPLPNDKAAVFIKQRIIVFLQILGCAVDPKLNPRAWVGHSCTADIDAGALIALYGNGLVLRNRQR